MRGPSLIERTSTLIDKLPDYDQREYYREQLKRKFPEHGIEYVKNVYEEEEKPDAIADEIMQEFSFLTGCDLTEGKSHSEALRHFGIDPEQWRSIPTIGRVNGYQKLYGGHEELKPFVDKADKYKSTFPRRFHSWHKYVLKEWESKNNLFQKLFPDNETAFRYLIEKRWPNGERCPYCDCHKIYTCKLISVNGTPRYKCAGCCKNFSPLVGTIFQETKLPLIKWFSIMWLQSSPKYKTMSTMQVSRCVGITQKSSWIILDRLKKASTEFNKELSKSLLQPVI